MLSFPLGDFVLGPALSAEELLQRQMAAEESDGPLVTPDEIAQASAAIRRSWTDENGVLCVEPHCEGGAEARSGIRACADPRKL